jgi:NAD(P)H-flavin reductase/ferredoxin
MSSVKYQDLTFNLLEHESVLEGLEKQGQVVPNSCRSGICQSCMMQAISGTPPPVSQQGLKQTLIQQNYFLACKCIPESDIEVALPSDSAISVPVSVIEKYQLNDDVLGLRLKPIQPFSCNPGQYINLVKDDLIRSYSVANLPDEDGYLELHIKRMTEGRMSNWLHDSLAVNDQITVRGPAGNCFYLAGDNKSFPLLLAGTGTGLAPLEGIARDALRNGHTGDITLIHGAPDKSAIYHEEELTEMANKHSSFNYEQSLRNDDNPEKADISALMNARLSSLDLQQTHVYLCGAPELVNKLKTQAFLQGVASSNIFCDPFITAPGSG